METTKKKFNTKLLAQIALLIAIELVMRLLGLGSVPIGPLNMSFLTLPIAVGAMLIGPTAGLILGAVFGITSLWDAISGRSAMTNFFFQFSPVSTIILCVGMRILMAGQGRKDLELLRGSALRSSAEHSVLHGLHSALLLQH